MLQQLFLEVAPRTTALTEKFDFVRQRLESFVPAFRFIQSKDINLFKQVFNVLMVYVWLLIKQRKTKSCHVS